MNQFACRVRAPRAPQGFERIRACMLVAGSPVPANGDRLVFFHQPDGGHQVQLGRGTCKSCEPVTLSRMNDIVLMSEGKGSWEHGLTQREIERLAQEAGYGSALVMFTYFEKSYGLPFNGTLLRW